jgi:hypothetical protein
VLLGLVRVADAGDSYDACGFDIGGGVADECAGCGLCAEGVECTLDQVGVWLEECGVVAGAGYDQVDSVV